MLQIKPNRITFGENSFPIDPPKFPEALRNLTYKLRIMLLGDKRAFYTFPSGDDNISVNIKRKKYDGSAIMNIKKYTKTGLVSYDPIEFNIIEFSRQFVDHNTIFEKFPTVHNKIKEFEDLLLTIEERGHLKGEKKERFSWLKK